MVVRSGLGLMILAPAMLVAGCQSDPMPVESASAEVSKPIQSTAAVQISPGPMNPEELEKLERESRQRVLGIQTPPEIPEVVDLPIARSNFAHAPKTMTVEASEVPAQPTRILNRASAERLFGNSGITLQWISWEERGKAWVAVDEAGVWWLSAEQGSSVAGLKLEGYVSEIGADYFIFNGEITIAGTPDASRFCDTNKEWRFGITQNRKYWRLREFEWCDGLTDYVDIYF